MASEASLAEQTADEVEGSKVINTAKIVEEDIVSQPKQAEESELEKDRVEEPANSETSLADPKEMVVIKDEASATKAVKKEDEDDTAPVSGVLGDKKEGALSVDGVKMETDSQTSSSEALGDPKEASVTVEVKKENEDDTASASRVLEVRKEHDPAVDEVKKETDSQGSGSEVLGDNKEASAAEEVKKEEDDDRAPASVVLEDNKEDASAVVEVNKETDDSRVSGSEVLVDSKKVSAAEEVKKEDENYTASASVVLEDNKEDTPAVDEAKKKTVDSQASGSEVLVDNNDGASVVEDVKKEAGTEKASSIADAEVEASTGGPDENSLNTTESLSEAVNKTLQDSSSSSVQESKHVGYEPEVSKLVVEIAKGIEESLDVSTDPDLASEALAKSEEHPIALTVLEPAPDAIGELERKIGTSEANDIVEAAKDENAATVEDKAMAEPLKEESVVEAESSESQSLDIVPGDSAEVEAKGVGRDAISENTEKAGDDTNASGCQGEAKIGESEHSATESLGKGVTVDTNLPNPPIATDETRAMDATVVTDAAEIVVNPETNIEEQKGERTVEIELIEEPKEERIVEEEPVKEQDQEKVVEIESILTATGKDEPSEDADELFEQSELGVSSSAAQPTENLEKEKAPQVNDELAKEPKLERVDTEDNTTPAQASRDIDQSGPATEAVFEEEKPSEGADEVVEQREWGVPDSATKSTKNLEKEKASEVAEQSVEEVKHENESIKDDTILAPTSRCGDLGEQTNESGTSTKEAVVKLDSEKPSADAAEKDETEKTDEAEKNDGQDLVEALKDGVDSKTNPEVQKAEASGKSSKTLMSKVKHSIVKVKKAIIGKSPSSKTMSAESKDELKA